MIGPSSAFVHDYQSFQLSQSIKNTIRRTIMDNRNMRFCKRPDDFTLKWIKNEGVESSQGKV